MKIGFEHRFFFRDDSVADAIDAAKRMKASSIAFPNQVHGNRTIIMRESSHGVIDADGIVADVPGLTLAIRFADCQNFLIYSRQQHVLGLLHAGWRGLAAHAIEEFFRVLTNEWNIDPKDTIVIAGPSLCKNCAEFSDPHNELPAHLHPFIDGRCVDLIAAAEHVFDTLGIPKEQRERHPDCTKCNLVSYWSHRAMSNEMPKEKNVHRNFLLGYLR